MYSISMIGNLKSLDGFAIGMIQLIPFFTIVLSKELIQLILGCVVVAYAVFQFGFSMFFLLFSQSG